MMTFFLRDIISFDKYVQSNSTKKLTLRAAYKIAKIQSAIADEILFYQTEFNKILEEYSQRDEEGNFKLSEDKQTILIKEDKLKECQLKLKELDDMEIELNIENILLDFDDFDSSEQISVSEINTILPFLK